ncbi:ABC transporter substrate-binding protein [Anatilimnocola sp. NA78]|uniref:ABC transporter substrate-binding protein n=1 Tax=Anatilimnocola sp. NA78 TaxID=3415683 RepID=UPI003CE47400
MSARFLSLLVPTGLLAILLGALLGSGCSRPTSSGETLIYAQASDPKTLDPVNTDIAESVHVITNVFDTLVTYDDLKAELVPSLAEKWTVSEDGKVWTFTLRDGVLFHDGTKLDSAAVKTTFDRLIADKHPLLYDSARPYQSSYTAIERIETPDPLTVVFHLKSPSAIFLTNLAMFPASIVSPAALKAKGKEFADSPVGTGPFKVIKWNRDQQLVLQSFDKHWRGAPEIKNLVIVPVKDNTTRIQRLLRGEVHLVDSLAPQDFDAVKKTPLVVLEQTGMNVSYLTMQMEKPPLNLLKVRQAIGLAIDKKTLMKVGFDGHAEPAVSMVPPGMWGHDTSLVDHEFNVAKAKQLMQEAADEAGFKLPVSLNLSVMSQARPYLPQPTSMAGFLKDSLREIGIEVTVTGRDVNEHFAHLMAGRHELGLAGWSSDNADPDNFLYQLLDPDNISENGNNLSRFRDQRFHELLLAGQTEMDLAKRLPLYHEAQAIVLREVPVVPLAHTQLRAVHDPRLTGFNLHPTGLIRLGKVKLKSQPENTASKTTAPGAAQ